MPVVAAIAGLTVPARHLPAVQRVGRECAGVGSGDLHRHRVPHRRAGHHQAEIPCPAADLPAHPGGGRRHRRALRDRAVLLRRIQVVPLLIAVVLIVAIALVRFLPAGRGPAYAVLGVRAVDRAVHGRRSPHAGRRRGRAADPRLHTRAYGRWSRPSTLIRAFRQSPNSEYARAATRGLRESISINERLQTAVRPLCVVPGAAAVRVGQRRACGSTRTA